MKLKNKKTNKKAQMKVQQMAFMLIAVTIFLVMAAMFILVIRFSSLRDTAGLLEEKNALLLVSKVADSPEFSCGNAFGTTMSNCIDMDKAMALKGRLRDYSGFWGIDGLEIMKVYPKNTGTAAGAGTECNPENYPDCGKITILSPSAGTGVSNFVSLCRNEQEENSSLVYGKCEIGRIIITYGS
ncbi:MAG: hypothetical protein AABX79_03255 [Nanoarchaeota archaeon]